MTNTETLHGWAPDHAVVPGSTLQETLAALGMTQRELASRSGLSPKTVNRIVNGDDPITPETANKLELVTGVPASLWNNLEKAYRERLTKAEHKRHLATYYGWIKEKMRFPIAELRRRGVLPKSRKREDVVEAVFKFLGVTHPEAWEKTYEATRTAFRRSPRLKSKPGLAAAWLRLAEIEAGKVNCKPFSPQGFKEALLKARGLTTTGPETFVEELQRVCAKGGVALVFVPEFKGGGVNGATRWLTPEKAMIALNLRRKYLDTFWFTFFHEAGHVLKHGKKVVFIDAEQDGDRDEQEKEADRFASDVLIPRSEVPHLLDLRTAHQIQVFANRIGVHAGIVVGRLCHEGFVRHGTAQYKELDGLRPRLEWKREAEEA